tara:strand:- start:54 stop:302 length:249 start_codon:yes stop_codon:yes gene_type:complete
MKISNIVNTLLARTLGPEKSEVSGTWTICIPCEGDVQRYDTTSFIQAEALLNDWLLAGWPAWIEDNSGNLIHSAATLTAALN